MTFYDAIKKRRSKYNITNKSSISDNKIQETLKYALKYTPTAFNSQNGRIILLNKEASDKLWAKLLEILKKDLSKEKFKKTKKKILGFKNGYGTVLFFQDLKDVKYLQNRFPLYSESFPKWSEQSIGMLQYIVWTLFADQGLGASLQHYSNLIEDFVKENWKVEDSWKLVSQMPFGVDTTDADEKEFKEMDERFKVYDK